MTDIHIIRSFNGISIRQRVADDYFDATAMCKAHGKLWGHYYENKTTKAFIAERSRSIGIPIDILIQVISTGLNENRGTWIHPTIALDVAQWISVEFRSIVNAWLYDKMQGKDAPDWYAIARNPPPELVIALIAQAEVLKNEKEKLLQETAEQQTVIVQQGARLKTVEPSHELLKRLADENIGTFGLQEAARGLHLSPLNLLIEMLRQKKEDGGLGWMPPKKYFAYATAIEAGYMMMDMPISPNGIPRPQPKLRTRGLIAVGYKFAKEDLARRMIENQQADLFG